MERCRTCRFCHITMDIGQPDPWDFSGVSRVDYATGLCRANPPIAAVQDLPVGDGGSYRGVRTQWPEINPDCDWCGKHSPPVQISAGEATETGSR